MRRSVRAILAAAATALALTGIAAAPSSAVSPGGTSSDNPWLRMRVMHMAHQGGELEAPSNTMYAFDRAKRLGADMLELDVHGTKDGRLVVIHDATVDRTTNGTGRIVDMTLDEVRELDAAYDFAPEQGYPFRGVRTGDVRPPVGYKARDFRIPTLKEVFRTFRHTPINIEIKGTADDDIASFLRNAELLAKELRKARRTDVIVVSFQQQAIDHFHTLMPDVATAPGVAGLAGYVLSGVMPGNNTKALQVPTSFAGIPIVTPEFVQRAHNDGFAVHVWLDVPVEETEQVYNDLIDVCVDGIMTAAPSRLEGVLRERDIVRPGRPGVDPCA